MMPWGGSLLAWWGAHAPLASGSTHKQNAFTGKTSSISSSSSTYTVIMAGLMRLPFPVVLVELCLETLSSLGILGVYLSTAALLLNSDYKALGIEGECN